MVAEYQTIPRLELDEHIDIALRTKIVSQHGAEKGESTDMVPAAKLGNLLSINCDVQTHD